MKTSHLVLVAGVALAIYLVKRGSCGCSSQSASAASSSSAEALHTATAAGAWL